MTIENQAANRLYLFNSRLITHVIFWFVYYITFSLVWAKDGNYFASFYLEFILLPVRIAMVYMMIYWLMPNFLLKEKYRQFLLLTLMTLLIAGFMQRTINYLFYEYVLLQSQQAFFNISAIIRSMLLINTTVVFVAGLKMYQLYLQEKYRTQAQQEVILEARSNRRTHLINSGHVLYIQGMGNYVNFHLSDGTTIDNYASIKATLAQLPEHFVQVHKSYIINKHYLRSYDRESVEINQHMIPIGKQYTEKLAVKI
ncbi:LytR/AlgR family response regulator transcription factor [Marinicella sp. W31]|uniref:LytR/AlgR family response regulator transcription factor n=1 Tax=Marinicella sp. W31 TaxID=3023713 RepID=UPI0037578485